MSAMSSESEPKPTFGLRLARVWTRAGRAALDTLYPPICLACRAATSEAGALCSSCWRAMRFIERPFCDRLGTPFEHDLGEGLLSPQARSVARFEDGPARRLVHRLKYSDRGELAAPMGAWMARAGADVLAEADAITPVPLHARRLWTRRFNQAAALGREIARRAGKPFEPALLRRIKATRSQVGLSREQRVQNMQGAFRAAPAASVQGRRIALVDDVLTSGATANAAARALLRAGAAQVDLIVFARVVTSA
jgi:ComF family protein